MQNLEEHPESSNAYSNLDEAYMINGQKEVYINSIKLT
jgi:hypothetical protein